MKSSPIELTQQQKDRLADWTDKLAAEAYNQRQLLFSDSRCVICGTGLHNSIPLQNAIVQCPYCDTTYQILFDEGDSDLSAVYLLSQWANNLAQKERAKNLFASAHSKASYISQLNKP
jgi:DNA-directed RNA polymerase subunit RPC12/RpoP